ncbi:uncharacterized protein Tco025E_01919 [Trypanosoma conorhini]|uniref:Uncharacterized protein n=1 Tax=Trypanosoma conorhini TaxID=83891 RepID=A0A422Q7F0_9TRYP|nr:uncharacterized protein Tco025E_01919 [Trypanosoma conorhini]RNF25915.1 hypothetical protein Tco025E_01919 [Trypanosoma conorhini]
MLRRGPRLACLSWEVKRNFGWLLFFIVMLYVISFVVVWLLSPLVQESWTASGGSPVSVPVPVTLRERCSVKMYRHFPVSLSFTASLEASMKVLGRQGCASVRALLQDAGVTRCPQGFALQCVAGYACSILDDATMNMKALKDIWGVRYTKAKRDEKHPWLIIVNHRGISPSNLVHQGNAVLSALGLAHLVARIERYIRACRVPSAEAILAACALENAKGARKQAKRFVLVELATGNANLLFSLCPPDPLRRLRCYGVEPVPALSADAMSYQEHIRIVNSGVSPLRDGSATHVLLHGILHQLPVNDSCALIREGLRLLGPNGVLLVVMLFTGTSAAWPTGHHPFFFKNTAVETDPLNVSHGSTVLRYCSSITGEDYDQLVEKVEFLWNAPEFVFYTPEFKRTGVYAVRLTRSAKMMSPLPGEERRTATPEEEEPALYKTLCTNPNNLDHMRDAQALWGKRVLEMHHASVRRKLRKKHYVWSKK